MGKKVEIRSSAGAWTVAIEGAEVFDGELWDTEHDAVQYGPYRIEDLEPGQDFVVGQCRPLDITGVVDAHRALEQLQEYAYNEVGDTVLGDWPFEDLGDEDIKELQAVLDNAIGTFLRQKGAEPAFYSVDRTKTVTWEPLCYLAPYDAQRKATRRCENCGKAVCSKCFVQERSAVPDDETFGRCVTCNTRDSKKWWVCPDVD